MAQEYFSAKQTSTAEEPRSPALNDADEAFLKRITSDLDEPTNEVVIFDDKNGGPGHTSGLGGAEEIPLPTSPPELPERPVKEEGKKEEKSKTNRLSGMFSTIRSKVPLSFGKKQDRSDAGEHMQSIATSVKTGEPLVVVSKEEADKENQDITSILDQLNLSAVNNRAFSFSTESQKLMADFTQILKDIVNGVPTAYDDLEKLLTRSDTQLRGMFDNLPPFLQNLVKSLPSKMTASIAPGLLAAASEKPGADAKMMGTTGSNRKSKRSVPLLKHMVKGDVVVGMLKSILNFLKLRFPALIGGTNILLSMAVFLLLFVFWYCYKRGRDTRLEKERLTADGTSDLDSSSDLDDSIIEDKQKQPTTNDKSLKVDQTSESLPETSPGK